MPFIKYCVIIAKSFPQGVPNLHELIPYIEYLESPLNFIKKAIRPYFSLKVPCVYEMRMLCRGRTELVELWLSKRKKAIEIVNLRYNNFFREN